MVNPCGKLCPYIPFRLDEPRRLTEIMKVLQHEVLSNGSLCPVIIRLSWCVRDLEHPGQVRRQALFGGRQPRTGLLPVSPMTDTPCLFPISDTLGFEHGDPLRREHQTVKVAGLVVDQLPLLR
jgi:hypothetical protein